MFTRFNGNVVPFADDSTSTNRTVFGGTTQSDLIDDNLNTNFKKGWEIVGLNDNPTREDFNAMGYTLGALISYLYEMGISEWNTSQNYRVNSRVIGSDGKIYKSLTGTTGIPNVGNNPTTDAVNWELEFKNFVTLTGNQTIAGGKTFSSNPISTATQSTAVNALTRKDYVDGLDSANVKLTGDQTVGGIKTFTSSPIVPTPTSSDNSTKVATTAFVKNNVPAVVSASETVAGIIELATTAEAQAGTDNSRAITPLKLKTALNASGTAPIYACRAWVNFNGQGTVAIRASGNVSSITDYGVGAYTVNFTTAMPDSNYSVSFVASNSTPYGYVCGVQPYGQLTTSFDIFNNYTDQNSYGVYDFSNINLSVFR